MDLKRIFDIVCAAGGLIVLAPVLLIIIALIKLDSPGPIFFRQTRVGQYEQLFQIHKFRTMVVNAEQHGPKITVGRDARITPIGHFLRKTKLDELPQLIDVVLGNMSLVGPRPEVPEYVEHYPLQARKIIFQVRPGITDWASLKMIDENELLAKTSNPQQAYLEQILPEKLEHAVSYVQNRNLFIDLKLIFLTIAKIFTR